MKIISVIPISKGSSLDVLTYFHKDTIEPGSIVKIPLRKKSVYGLVLETREAETVKSEIKSLSFNLKKIEELKSQQLLLKGFVEATKKIAQYNASSLGGTLFSLVPQTILEESGKIFFTPKNIKKTSFYEVSLIQAENEERFATYKSLVREEFARNNSVFFCVPTIEDLTNAKSKLEKGIEKYTFVFHSGLTKKEVQDNWKKACEETHPILIIGTGTFLSIPRSDLGTIIIEKEASRGYKTINKPFLDIRNVAEILAKEIKARLVLGDTLLRIETLWEEKKGKYATLSPLKFRSISTADCQMVDMKVPQDMKKKEFQIIGDKIKSLIKENIEDNGHLFLFCSRKGLYPQTICSDCGTVVSCKNCKTPLVLYERRVFVCNHCGENYDSKMLCSKCSGWRLTPLGIGTENVYEEIKKFFPEVKLFIFDKEHVTTQKKAEKLRDTFYNTAGSICIGTEMALSYLNQKIERSAVVSIDSYFSLPDFQINEKIFHILLEMRSVSMKDFIIQSRKERVSLFEYAIKGNLLDFYRDEIKERKDLGYPPFNIYIKFTLTGEKTKISKEMEKLKEFFKPMDMQIFDAWNPSIKNKHTINGLLYMPREKWPENEVLEKIKSLPPYFSVRIDPSNLL